MSSDSLDSGTCPERCMVAEIESERANETESSHQGEILFLSHTTFVLGVYSHTWVQEKKEEVLNGFGALQRLSSFNNIIVRQTGLQITQGQERQSASEGSVQSLNAGKLKARLFVLRTKSEIQRVRKTGRLEG